MTDEFLTGEEDNDNEQQPRETRVSRGLKRAFYVVFWIAMFATAIILDAIFFPHPYLNAWEYFFGST